MSNMSYLQGDRTGDRTRSPHHVLLVSGERSGQSRFGPWESLHTADCSDTVPRVSPISPMCKFTPGYQPSSSPASSSGTVMPAVSPIISPMFKGTVVTVVKPTFGYVSSPSAAKVPAVSPIISPMFNLKGMARMAVNPTCGYSSSPAADTGGTCSGTGGTCSGTVMYEPPTPTPPPFPFEAQGPAQVHAVADARAGVAPRLPLRLPPGWSEVQDESRICPSRPYVLYGENGRVCGVYRRCTRTGVGYVVPATPSP